MKLVRLALYCDGAEFAGRQQKCVEVYAGASFIVRNHSHRETDWGFCDGIVDDFMSGYDVPEPAKLAAR